MPACTVTDDALSGSEFVTVSVADSHSVSVSVSGFFGSENNRSVIRFLF